MEINVFLNWILNWSGLYTKATICNKLLFAELFSLTWLNTSECYRQRFTIIAFAEPYPSDVLEKHKLNTVRTKMFYSNPHAQTCHYFDMLRSCPPYCSIHVYNVPSLPCIDANPHRCKTKIVTVSHLRFNIKVEIYIYGGIKQHRLISFIQFTKFFC